MERTVITLQNIVKSYCGDN